MAGTKEGGRKAAAKNLANDPDFYSKIGKKGGAKSSTGGFASLEIGEDGLTGPQRASVVGVLGGRNSKPGTRKKLALEIEMKKNQPLWKRMLRKAQ